MRVWQLYEKEGQYQARLHWSSIPNLLNVTRTLIQNVEGWDREGNQLNYTLLTQRGAIQEPFVATKARHKDKKLASDVTQLKPKKLASEWSDDYLKFLLEKEDRSSKEERHLWLGLDKMNKVTGASLNHSTTALPPNNPTITPSLPVLHSHFA